MAGTCLNLWGKSPFCSQLLLNCLLNLVLFYYGFICIQFVKHCPSRFGLASKNFLSLEFKLSFWWFNSVNNAYWLQRVGYLTPIGLHMLVIHSWLLINMLNCEELTTSSKKRFNMFLVGVLHILIMRDNTYDTSSRITVDTQSGILCSPAHYRDSIFLDLIVVKGHRSLLRAPTNFFIIVVVLK